MFLKSPFGDVAIKYVKYVSKNSALTSTNNQAQALTSGMLPLLYELKNAHETNTMYDTLHADTFEWNFVVTLSSFVILLLFSWKSSSNLLKCLVASSSFTKEVNLL